MKWGSEERAYIGNRGGLLRCCHWCRSSAARSRLLKRIEYNARVTLHAYEFCCIIENDTRKGRTSEINIVRAYNITRDFCCMIHFNNSSLNTSMIQEAKPIKHDVLEKRLILFSWIQHNHQLLLERKGIISF